MNYVQGVSIKAIAIGFLGGYFLPYLVVKALGYAFYALGIHQLFGVIPLLIVLLVAVVAPLASGYLGAKYCSRLPILNGMAATVLGVSVFLAVGEASGLFVYLAVVVMALLLGYVGARRYVQHG